MSNYRSGGIGLGGILTIIFVFLKVFEVIDWSWWWVFAPLWIPIALIAVIYLLVFLAAFITSLFSE